MAKFQYKGRSRSGAVVSGELEADNAQAAAADLLGKQITPLDIKLKKSGEDINALLQSLTQPRKVTLEELQMFCMQMYSLTKAGVPIIRAISGQAESARNPLLAKALNDVRIALESGIGIGNALRAHPKIFEPLFINMISVGENTGRLEDAFQRLSQYMELERETRKRMSQATRYPTFVIIAVTIAMAVINVMVIPAFAGVFSKFGAELPIFTRILMATSTFTINYWWVLVGALVIAGVTTRNYLNTEAGALAWDRYKLRLPAGIGNIFTQLCLARFTRTFSMMFQAGIPVLQALSITAGAVGNRHLGQAIEGMRSTMERGESLSRSAMATGLFSPLVLQMMTVGEETGEIDRLLLEVADFYDREADYALKRLGDAIEPILMVFMGGIVLVLALGVFLPMWDLGSAAMGKH